MSHANGEVIHGGKVVGHFEYNGTSDVAFSRIFPTKEEMHKHWRSATHENEAECSCGRQPVDVLLYTDYGNGCYWPAKACLDCGSIVAGCSFDDCVDGHPLSHLVN